VGRSICCDGHVCHHGIERLQQLNKGQGHGQKKKEKGKVIYLEICSIEILKKVMYEELQCPISNGSC
jgi:hypothetical protein